MRFLVLFQHFAGGAHKRFDISKQLTLLRRMILSSMKSSDDNNEGTPLAAPKAGSAAEECFYNIIKEVAAERLPNATVSSNVYLAGCFECDIFISLNPVEDAMTEDCFLLPRYDIDKTNDKTKGDGDGDSDSKEGKEIVLFDIEVDGPTHEFPSKINFTQLRDGFLR